MIQIKVSQGKGTEGRVRERYERGVIIMLYPRSPAQHRRLLAMMYDNTHRVLSVREALLSLLCAEFYLGPITFCLCSQILLSSFPGVPANTFSHQFLWRLELIWCVQSPIIIHNVRLSGGQSSLENKDTPFRKEAPWDGRSPTSSPR